MFLAVFACCTGPKGKEEAGGSRVAVHDTAAVNEKSEGPVIRNGLPTVIDFYAEWCGPCKRIAPLFDELKEQCEGKANFVRVDVDEDADMAMKYRIEAMPTFVFLDADGNETGRIVGADADGLKASVAKISGVTL